MRYGYACINLTLADQGYQINRSMIRKTFLEKGINYASELSLKNIIDFEKIIDWNLANDFLLYRMSSDMFPWMSEYELSDLPDYKEIAQILARCGQKAKAGGLRLTTHPGPYNVLASSSEEALRKTYKELRQHAQILDLLDMPLSPYSKINIHVGGAYGDKEKTLVTFAENYQKLDENVKKRLTIENDDKKNMYSVKDLLILHKYIGIPIVFDYLHHQLCSGGWSEKEAFLAATDTWPIDIIPIVHYSSSKKIHEDQNVPLGAHADFLYEHINTYGREVDIMVEAKAKNLAVIKYLKDFVK